MTLPGFTNPAHSVTAAEKYDNVFLHFGHKLRSFDIRKNELKFERWVRRQRFLATALQLPFIDR